MPVRRAARCYRSDMTRTAEIGSAPLPARVEGSRPRPAAHSAWMFMPGHRRTGRESWVGWSGARFERSAADPDRHPLRCGDLERRSPQKRRKERTRKSAHSENDANGKRRSGQEPEHIIVSQMRSGPLLGQLPGDGASMSVVQASLSRASVSWTSVPQISGGMGERGTGRRDTCEHTQLHARS